MAGFFPKPIKQFKTLTLWTSFSKDEFRPFVLRRLKKDVLKGLPDKIETNL